MCFYEFDPPSQFDQAIKYNLQTTVFDKVSNMIVPFCADMEWNRNVHKEREYIEFKL